MCAVAGASGHTWLLGLVMMKIKRKLVASGILLLMAAGPAAAEVSGSADRVVSADSGGRQLAAYTLEADRLRGLLDAPTGQLPAFDAAPASLGLLDAVRLAVDWHPTIRDAASIVLQREGEVDVSRAGYLPQLSAGVNAGRQGERGYAQILSLDASQMLYDFGKVDRTVESAEAIARRDQASLLAAVDDVARRVAQAVIEVQRYQTLHEIARSQVRAIDEVAQITRLRSNLGASTRLDPIQAQVRFEAAQATEQQLATQLEIWRTSLRSAIGTSLPARLDADAPGALETACELKAPEFARVPMVMMAEADRVAATAQAEFARARKRPTITLNGGLNHAVQGELSAGMNQRSESRLTVNLTAPLYQGGALDAQERAALHALDAARARVEAARVGIYDEWLRALDDARGLRARLVVLAAREQNVIATRALYREQYLALGTRSALDLLNAEEEIHQAAFDFHNAAHDLRAVQISCLAAAGRLRAQFGLDNTLVQGFEIRP